MPRCILHAKLQRKQGLFFLVEALCGEAMDAKALEGQKGLVVRALNDHDIDDIKKNIPGTTRSYY